MSLLAEVMASGQVLPGAGLPLQAPVLLNSPGDFENSTAATITTSSVSPGASSTVLILNRHRAGSSRTHNLPTLTGLTNAGVVTLAASQPESNAAATVFWRISAYTCKFTGPAGTGTFTCTYSGTTFQREVEVYDLGPNVATSPIQQSQVNSIQDGVAGSFISATLGSTPLATSLVMGCGLFGDTRTGNVRTPAAGFTELTDDGNAAGIGWETEYQLFGAPAIVSVSTIQSAALRIMLALEIAQA